MKNEKSYMITAIAHTPNLIALIIVIILCALLVCNITSVLHIESLYPEKIIAECIATSTSFHDNVTIFNTIATTREHSQTWQYEWNGKTYTVERPADIGADARGHKTVMLLNPDSPENAVFAPSLSIPLSITALVTIIGVYIYIILHDAKTLHNHHKRTHVNGSAIIKIAKTKS